jgi:hydrogenase maturation protein HypF
MGQPIESGRPLQDASRLLDEGAILGVKGIGGVHVAASAILNGPLDRIRARKGKPFQPFAVMSRDLGEIREFADFSDLEAQLLEDWRRPIVALRKSSGCCLSKLVAPNLDTVGVMLPYTGIHLLLTHFSRSKALVMTSGNITGMPMAITNEEAVRQLSDVVDYFLLHDREIVARCDDSVIRVLGGVPTFIRRSRGYVPIPVEVPFTVESDAIGFGAELRVTGSVLHKNHCYLTQHIGDVDNFEAVSFLRDAIQHLSDLIGISPEEAVIVHDAHPRYLSSRLAGDLSRKWGTRIQPVQHHHAHAASLMAENMVPPDESMVVIAADGVGYGLDGDVWGGEVLVASYGNFERVGHLARQPMPGGDACTRFPLRMCASMLSQHFDDSRIRAIILSRRGRGCLNEDDLDRLVAQIESEAGLNWTSSTGRVLDAMAAGAGLCLERTYEGEPAMVLEAAAEKGNREAFSPKSDLIINRGGIRTVDTSQLLLEALLAIDRIGFSNVCASFQRILSKALASIATEVAKERGINRVGVSGGVAVNVNIVETIREHIEGERLMFVQHRVVPPGDGGIALGQVVIAAHGL